MLFVAKTNGRVSIGTAHGKAVDAQLVIDDCTDLHFDFAGREAVKIQPEWRAGFQIAGIGKNENPLQTMPAARVLPQNLRRHAWRLM